MSISGVGYDPKSWLNSYKANKTNTEETSAVNSSSANKVDTFTRTATASTKTAAADFDNTTDYHNYLKETYSSIESENIKISDKVLQQAMGDPEKEKVLVDFLTGIEGAKDMRTSQIEGLNDDTHSYELTKFSIVLDSIAEDNSGVIGTNFNEITVERNDGKRISKDEFKEIKSTVSDLFDQIEAQREQQAEQLTKNMKIRNETKLQEAKAEAKEKIKEDAAEKLEEKREAAKEQVQVQKEESEKSEKDPFFSFKA